MWVSEGITSPEAKDADLESVPGVGIKTAADLRTPGIFSVDTMKKEI